MLPPTSVPPRTVSLSQPTDLLELSKQGGISSSFVYRVRWGVVCVLFIRSHVILVMKHRSTGIKSHMAGKCFRMEPATYPPHHVFTGVHSESEICSVMSDSLQPHDYTVHGILQARILEWVAFLFTRGPSQPRDQIQVSRIAGGFFPS